MGDSVDTRCVLCHHGPESVAHLFFNCPYSVTVYRHICAWLGIRRELQAGTSWQRWLEHLSCGTAFRNRVLITAITGGVYHIWHERNVRVHGKDATEAAFVLLRLKRDIKMRLALVPTDMLRSWDLVLWEKCCNG